MMDNQELKSKQANLLPTKERELAEAVRAGAKEYFDSCRAKIPGFIRQHYRYPGAWNTNKVALGFDLLRSPFNLIWAPFYVLSLLLAWFFRAMKLKPISTLLLHIPSGLTTRLQKSITEKTLSQVLQDPRNDQSELIQCIQTSIEKRLLKETPATLTESQKQHLKSIIEDSLKQYAITRTASSDISNTILGTAIGAIAFKKFTPGGLGIGVLSAYLIEKQMAVSQFMFGKTAGGIYYDFFPPEPSFTLIVITTTAVLCCLAIFASLSGLLTDPIQSWTGIHSRRLKKMIHHLESDFENKTFGGFRPKDQYLARIMELVDTVKVQFT